jgi:hypothetical protein
MWACLFWYLKMTVARAFSLTLINFLYLWINYLCSSTVYPLVVAAHPSEPNQFSLGLTDGGVVVLEPGESEGKWGTGPPAENGAVSSVTIVPKAGTPGSEQGTR